MTVTAADVIRVRDELVARGRTGAEVLMGVRSEVYGLLELDSPLPGADAVRDEHRIEADKARALDPHFTSAHHWLQKLHASSLWAQVDRLVAEAGVK